MDLAHLVVAMTGDRIAKAECKTCKKIHAYKAPKGVKTPKPKKERAPRAEKKTVEVSWQELMDMNKAKPSKGYNTKGAFVVGDKVNHPTFGEGIVERLIYPNKFEIIFQTSMKILIHAGNHQA